MPRALEPAMFNAPDPSKLPTSSQVRPLPMESATSIHSTPNKRPSSGLPSSPVPSKRQASSPLPSSSLAPPPPTTAAMNELADLLREKNPDFAALYDSIDIIRIKWIDIDYLREVTSSDAAQNIIRYYEKLRTLQPDYDALCDTTQHSINYMALGRRRDMLIARWEAMLGAAKWKGAEDDDDPNDGNPNDDEPNDDITDNGEGPSNPRNDAGSDGTLRGSDRFFEDNGEHPRMEDGEEENVDMGKGKEKEGGRRPGSCR
jgi:hypothetical protein